MKVYVVVGYNGLLGYGSAAVYSKREDAEAHINDPERMYDLDSAIVCEHELDGRLVKA